jgi:hypothetical protein
MMAKRVVVGLAEDLPMARPRKGLGAAFVLELHLLPLEVGTQHDLKYPPAAEMLLDFAARGVVKTEVAVVGGVGACLEQRHSAVAAVVVLGLLVVRIWPS